MTVIARKVASIPQRSALETWNAITELLAPDPGSPARQELHSVAGIASSLIAREAIKDSPIVVHGSGPRVRIYGLYNEDAITSEDANERPLPFDATGGDWLVSLPCRSEDLEWVEAALKRKGSRITAREQGDDVGASGTDSTANRLEVNKEAFFRS